MSASGYYILEGGEIKPCSKLERNRWMDSKPEEKIVAQDQVGDVKVVTVFLTMNFNLSGKGPPTLFETVIINWLQDSYTELSSTIEEARESHERALDYVVANNPEGIPEMP